ncbi:hypothetical protein AB0D67_35180 [Streptosporangium sp. NPDC048047]|uniref:hypothetical protein n=1 Tax=Streptosporangium sp. NPDC048047 TaxID=3155748 RepID=UPI0034225147
MRSRAPGAPGIAASGTGRPGAMTGNAGGGALAGTPWLPGFPDLLRSEWAKLRTLRSTWVTALAVVLTGALFATLFAGAGIREYTQGTAAERADFDPFDAVFRAMMFVQLVVGYLGLRTVTVEYAAGTMPGSLTAVPRRGRLLAAKAVACAALALPVGWATTLAVFAVGRAVLLSGGVPAYSLADPGVGRALAGGGLLAAATALLGLAAGFLVRATAGALTIMIMVGILVPAMAPLLPPWAAELVVKYWPANAGGRLLSVRPDPDLLAPWTGYALLCGYVAVALLGAFAVLRGRDA